ncbi:hypothetical protein [Aliikangiella maris]|uniref:Uncharacterized protein n=2 Tax=Aliikangiella maris TaxID=3162458 RepID=A0ABV3MUU7_9GAMM
MNRLEKDGVEVNAIRGHWYANSGSSNFEKFDSLIQSGMPKNQAAFETWTGQRAFEYGFTNIKSIEESLFGHYTVFFTK